MAALKIGNLTSFRRDCDQSYYIISCFNNYIGNLTSFRRDCDLLSINLTIFAFSTIGNLTSFRRDCDPQRKQTYKNIKYWKPDLI